MTTLHANESAQLQINDAHRACLAALCSLRLVAGDATDATLQSEVSRLHAGLCSIADELAELRHRARLADSCLNAAG
jgi:hypothetical protein